MSMDEDIEAIEEYDKYEDIIHEVLAGRTEGLKCPYCGKGELKIEFDGVRLRIECPECGRYFEGMLA